MPTKRERTTWRCPKCGRTYPSPLPLTAPPVCGAHPRPVVMEEEKG